MHPLKKHLVLASCLTMLAVSTALAQNNMFLSVTGIPGEAMSSSHPSTIVSTGFSVGVTNPVPSTPTFSDLSVTKFVDKASPLLALNCAQGTVLSSVVLYVQNSRGQDCFVISLANTRVRSVTTGGMVNGQPTETVTFNLFGNGSAGNMPKISISYTPFNSAGDAQPAIKMNYDIGANKAS